MVFCIIYILLLLCVKNNNTNSYSNILNIKNKLNQLVNTESIINTSGTDDRFLEENYGLDIILLHFQKKELLQKLQNNNLMLNSKLDLIEKSDLISATETIKRPNVFAGGLLKDTEFDF